MAQTKMKAYAGGRLVHRTPERQFQHDAAKLAREGWTPGTPVMENAGCGRRSYNGQVMIVTYTRTPS